MITSPVKNIKLVKKPPKSTYNIVEFVHMKIHTFCDIIYRYNFDKAKLILFLYFYF